MIVSLVIGHGKNFEIGAKGELPWRLSDDLKNFKRVTMGKPIIMGRKTFDSIGRPLPGRVNAVLTRDRDWSHEGVEVFHSLEETFQRFESENIEEVVIIGGENLLRQSMERVDIMHLTEVQGTFPEADAFFPRYDKDAWEVVDEFTHAKDEKNDFDWTFRTLKRKER